MKKVKIEIEGMTCQNCEKHVENEIKRIGAKKIKVSHVEKSAIFNINEFDDLKIKAAVKLAGYKPGKVYVKEEKGILGRLFLLGGFIMSLFSFVSADFGEYASCGYSRLGFGGYYMMYINWVLGVLGIIALVLLIKYLVDKNNYGRGKRNGGKVKR